MQIGKYKINSSVILASIIALIGGGADLLSNGFVIDAIAEVVAYFLQQPEPFRPYLTEKIYQILLVFLPVLSIFLRVHRTRGLPPVEKIEKSE